MKNIFKALKITILYAKFDFIVYVALLLTITLLPAIQLDCYQNIFSGLQYADIKKIFYTLCVYVTFDICSSFMTSASPLIKERIRSKVENVICKNLIDYLRNIPIDFFDISDNLCEIERAKRAAKQVIVDIATDSIRIIGSIIALIYLFDLLSSVSVIYYFIFFSIGIISNIFSQQNVKESKEVILTKEPLTRTIEFYQNTSLDKNFLREIKLFGINDWIKNKHNRTFTKYRSIILKFSHRWLRINIVWSTIAYFIEGIVLAITVIHYATSDFSLSNLALLIQIPSLIIDTISEIILTFSEIQKAAITIKSFDNIKQKSQYYKSKRNQVYTHSNSKTITFDHISFSYGQKEVLHNINLSITPGQQIAIIGSNGSGKSTLIKLLLGLLYPSTGKINIFTIKSAAIFQEPAKFKMSLCENIFFESFPVSSKDIDSAQHLLTDMGFNYSLSNNINLGSDLFEDGTDLSTGEWKKISLCTILMQNPDLLVLDEFTNNMDTSSIEKAVELIQTKMKGKTVIYVTHSPELAKNVDCIICMEDGVVTDIGTPQQLMHKENSVYRRLFEEAKNKPVSKRN